MKYPVAPSSPGNGAGVPPDAGTRQSVPGIWFGLGMMGLIGWSVAIPTLLGASLGLWLDRHYAGSHSWTLALLVAGLVLGCWNAWHWVSREQAEMHEEEEDDE